MQTGFQIYVKGSAEAVAFYQKAFNATLGMNFKGEDGSYAHASLMLGERELLAIAEDGKGSGRQRAEAGKCPVMTFNCWGLGTKEAVYQAYQVLSEGALYSQNPDGPASVPWSECCFCVVDKFGVHWWVSV